MPIQKKAVKQKVLEKVIKVNLDRQSVEAFEGDARIYRFDCVSGDKDHPTDRGKFKIIRREANYRSKTYDVQMNFALFFTNDGKALHQYHGPLPLSAIRAARNTVSEWFGSHGCVRLVESDAKKLFDWAPKGTIVHVS